MHVHLSVPESSFTTKIFPFLQLAVTNCQGCPKKQRACPNPALLLFISHPGVTYHFLSHPLIELAKKHMQKNSICAFCSRMKRGVLYSCMRMHGYNVLALGQHLDDVCESFVMSAFFNGSLNTMKVRDKNVVESWLTLLRVCTSYNEGECKLFLVRVNIRWIGGPRRIRTHKTTNSMSH